MTARGTLLSFQPTDEDQRLQDYLSGWSAPLGDPQATPEAPPAPDDTTQQDPAADAPTAQPQPDPTPAPAPAAQPMAAAPQPSQQDQLLQQLMASRGNAADPELTARWRKEEMGALDRADALRNQSYGGWESLRDVLPAIAPTILDIGFNKGRGLSGIVSATAQAAGQNEADHKAEIAKADDYALRLHQQRAAGHQVDPVTQMLAIGRLGVAQQNAGTGAKRVQGTEDWRGQQANPDSAYRTTQVTQAGRTRTASEQALLDTQHENNPRTAADKAAIEAAQTGAQIQTQLGYAPQQAAAAGMKSGAEQTARDASTHADAPIANQDAAARAAGIATATEGVTQSGSRDAQKAFADQAASYTKTHSKDLDAAGLIDEIDNSGGAVPQSFAERFGNAIATHGIDPKRLEPWQAKQLVLESWSRSQSGAAINASEGDKFAVQTGLSPMASQQSVDAAFNVMKRLIQRRLSAGAVGNAAAPDIMAQYVQKPSAWLSGGVKGESRPVDVSQVSAPRSYAPAAPAQSAADGGVDTTESLGPPQSMAPKVNHVMGAPPPPTALHHIQKPNGKVIETMLPPKQLQGLPAGWKVID